MISFNLPLSLPKLADVLSANIAARIFLCLMCLSALTINSLAQDSYVFAETSARKQSSESLTPAPITLSGNPTCADLNARTEPEYAFITSNDGLKLNYNPPPAGNSGPYTYQDAADREMTGTDDPGNSVSLQNVRKRTVDGDLTTLDFTSTRLVNAVIVKGGNGANIYLYPSGTLGGNPDGIGLMTPGSGNGPAISHVIFCVAPAAKVTIIKEVQTFTGGTSSTTSFPFTATNLGTANFSLIDDDAGPGVATFVNSNVTSFGGGANTITVTESLVAGWSLADLDCVETGVQNTTINFGARRANIIAEPGEQITCTFKNLQLQVTAANATLGGRVMTESGMPIRGATVTVLNANTLEVQTLTTGNLGYYSFNNLPVGYFYIVTVNHGKYNFPNNQQSFTLNEDLGELNFISADGVNRSSTETVRKDER